MSTLETNSIGKYNGNNVSVDDALRLKSYTTTQRNALTSVAGDMIFNTTTSKVEYYDGSAWASGTKVATVNALTIAGGGGGGGSQYNNVSSGGGGAGGYINTYNSEASGGGGSAVSSTKVVADGNTAYSVTIGAGGAGGINLSLIHI